MKNPKVSKRSEKLIERALDAAGEKHWQQDQGFGSAVNNAIAAYAAARSALLRHVARLEAQAAKAAGGR